MTLSLGGLGLAAVFMTLSLGGLGLAALFMTLSRGGLGLAALFMALVLGCFGRFDMEYLGLLISCRGFGCSISCLPLSPLPSEGMAFLLALENTFFGGLVTS